MAQNTITPEIAPELTESPRPQSSSLENHPALQSSVTNVPVTPGINLSTYESPAHSRDSSYFSSNHGARRGMAQSPSEAAQGAKSGHDILRRMSMVGTAAKRRNSLVDVDPRSAHPSLALSGGIISATFCIPHSVHYRKGADWELNPRRGNSALSDSFAHLSSDTSNWSHTLVGWTGEIKQCIDTISPPDTPPATSFSSKAPPLNRASAPIPVDGVSQADILPQNDGLWITKDDQAKLERQLAHDKVSKTIPVWLADEVKGIDGEIHLNDQGRWRRYSERELYTIFHYKQHGPTDGRAEKLAWADYLRMNRAFASRILDVYKPGDIVMIHDYHLMLLPSLLRQKIPHMYIGFFLHSPFPSSEFLRCLPRRKEVLEGVLGANMIGFQSYSYSRHFVSSCTRILGFPSDVTGVDAYGGKVTVGVFPIGIDAARVENLAFNQSSIDEKLAALKKMYHGKKIIVGRDRLDSVRGVAQKLMAFERFLELYPQWRETAVLIQVTSPTNIEEEREESENKVAMQVSELVAKINGTYGSLGFSPVQHYPQYLSQEEYFALLRLADIGLITSVRDGMNTTSLEYVVCQRDNHGPLILSEFSGTAGSLKDAIHINPWDLTGVADQINHALNMSDEKKLVQHNSLYTHVTKNNVEGWCSSLVKRLLSILASYKSTILTPILDKSTLVSQYQRATKRLFMFDYDGTLTPIVQDPAAAIPTYRLRETIRRLSEDPNNAVWIISGRDQDFLTQHLGDLERLGFSAEHGSFMRHPGSHEWENLAEKTDMSWQKEVMEIFQKWTEKTQGSFIERKRCALTWHYRRADPELGPHNASECRKELERTVGKKWDVEVMAGKANLEVRPTFINKGEIVKRLVADYGQDEGCAPEFVLCLGDDFTDEDMFRALNGSDLDEDHVFTVTVGASSKMTLAHWHLLEPIDVVDAISLLNGEEHAGDMGMLASVNVDTESGTAVATKVK